MSTQTSTIVRIGTAGALALSAAVLGSALVAQPAQAAEATPISTAAELKAMDAKGNYYLANDIDLAGEKDFKLFAVGSFKGTLDGRGHAIKNFTRSEVNKYKNVEVALFGRAYGATIKNLSLTGVNITVNTGRDIKCSALVGTATGGCRFENIKASGSIKVSSVNMDTEESYQHLIGGLFTSLDKKTTVTKCTNAININSQITGGDGVVIGGIATSAENPFSSCTNKGKISFSGTGIWTSSVSVAGIAGSSIGNLKLTKCVNSGPISVTIEKAMEEHGAMDYVRVVGLAPEAGATSSGNSGKITVTLKKGAQTNNVTVAGLIESLGSGVSNKIVPVTKCYNKGSITLEGSSWKPSSATRSIDVAGVIASAYAAKGVKKPVSQCYNKGAVKVSIGARFANVGGICAEFSSAIFSDNYNAGAISGKGNMFLGGLVGSASMVGKPKEGVVMEKNYNVGKVSLSGTKVNYKHLKPGAITGNVEGMDIAATRSVYDNYYTSGKPYPQSNVTWKAWVAKGVKVGSITSGNCPKLSSKTWTYSSKYKRLILKANKEN